MFLFNAFSGAGATGEEEDGPEEGVEGEAVILCSGEDCVAVSSTQHYLDVTALSADSDDDPVLDDSDSLSAHEDETANQTEDAAVVDSEDEDQTPVSSSPVNSINEEFPVASEEVSAKTATQSQSASLPALSSLSLAGEEPSQGRHGRRAGRTMLRDDEFSRRHTWRPCDGASFQLRGPNYFKTKVKQASASPFYEIVGVDFYKCSKRVDGVGGKVDFPEEWLRFEDPTIVNDTGLPTIFIVNAQLPSDFSPSFFTEVLDGDGWMMSFYFKITVETIQVIRASKGNPNGPLGLLKNYLIDGPPAFRKYGLASKNPWVGRFKVVARIENLDNFSFPGFITGYNAKPVLIRSCGELCSGQNFVEFDINVHKFNNLSKQGLQVMFNRFEEMIISFGFCVESLEQSELPEILLGSVSLNCPIHQQSSVWK